VDVITNCLGHHRSAIFRLLNKAKNLPLCKFLRGKRALGGQRRYQAMPLERFVKKNPRATDGNIKQQSPEESGISVQHINWLILKKLKMPSRIATQKLLLTEKIKKASFCQKNTLAGLQKIGARLCTLTKALFAA
jgi:hypothetical protein